MGKKRREELLGQLETIPANPMVKVNIGCINQRIKHGWINMDGIDIRELAQQDQIIFQHHDPRKPLPFKEDTVDLLYTGHYIQMLQPFYEAVPFLRECKRVLKPDGKLRVVTYDLHYYLSGEFEKHPELWRNNPQFNQIKTVDLRLSMVLFRNWEWQNTKEFYVGNQACYTPESLTEMFWIAGLKPVTPVNYVPGTFSDPTMGKEVVDQFPEQSFVLEGMK